MKKTIISLAVVTILTGCATGSAIREKVTGKQFDEPELEQSVFLKKETNKLKPPAGGPVPVAVYAFQDKTGQRKSIPNIASLSSAVTQGAESYLIKALQDVGEQRWFTVLERVGLDNLIKERQMIRQMREQYQGRDAKPLPPMMFAGIIVEGGIIGYDSNTTTGGSGVRLFGIGATTQYQSDTVTVNLRTVSVSSGEVLTSVTVTKTVLSYMDKFGVLKFVDSGTTAVEAETGGSINESINKATAMAIQAAVVATINEGARKGHWAFKDEFKSAPMPPDVVSMMTPPKVAPAPEVKVEEKKDELVQSQTSGQRAPEAAPTPPQPSNTESTGTSKTVESNKDSKKEVVPLEKLPSEMIFKELAYVYKEANDKSQKTWQFPKGTLVLILSTQGDWIEVRDANKRKGFVNKNVLVNKQQQ
jgi:curli production assembly/transport component CsgG